MDPAPVSADTENAFRLRTGRVRAKLFMQCKIHPKKTIIKLAIRTNHAGLSRSRWRGVAAAL
jgi:hypothetical protein